MNVRAVSTSALPLVRSLFSLLLPHSFPSSTSATTSSQSSYTNRAFLGRTFLIRDVDTEFGLQGEAWVGVLGEWDWDWAL